MTGKAPVSDFQRLDPADRQHDFPQRNHSIDETYLLIVGEVGDIDFTFPDPSAVEQTLPHGPAKEWGRGRKPLPAVVEYDVGIGGIGKVTVADDENFVAVTLPFFQPVEYGAVFSLVRIADAVVADKAQGVDLPGCIRRTGKVVDALPVIDETQLRAAHGQAYRLQQVSNPQPVHHPQHLSACAVHPLLVVGEVADVSVNNPHRFNISGHTPSLSPLYIHHHYCSVP